MLKKILKVICQCGIIAGVFGFIGSIGAFQNYIINCWQMILQLIISVAVIYLSFIGYKITDNY